MTIPSRRNYNDSSELIHAPDGHVYSFFKGGKVHTPLHEDTDYAATQAGCISVSRIVSQPCSAPGKPDLSPGFFKI